jgi:hypothetical protein
VLPGFPLLLFPVWSLTGVSLGRRHAGVKVLSFRMKGLHLLSKLSNAAFRTRMPPLCPQG